VQIFVPKGRFSANTVLEAYRAEGTSKSKGEGGQWDKRKTDGGHLDAVSWEEKRYRSGTGLGKAVPSLTHADNENPGGVRKSGV